MYLTLAFLCLVSVAAFAGGCLCLSITLSGLAARPALDGAQIMQALLPRMGAVMAPLLVCSVCSGGFAAWAGARAQLAVGQGGQGTVFVMSTLAFVLIALVTALVHLPLNAQFLAGEPLAPAHAAALVARWLGWHHVRTALALAALGTLLWPLRHGLGAT